MTANEGQATDFVRLTECQAAGVRRLRILLPALADYLDSRDDHPRDTCAVCGDGECGGACQGAMEVVRQVIDALGCGDDDWAWWVDYFEDERDIPPVQHGEADQ